MKKILAALYLNFAIANFAQANMIDLGTLATNDAVSASYGLGISGDGSIIFGESEDDLGEFVAFKYQNSTMSSVAGITSSSRAYGSSSDGLVVTGSYDKSGAGDFRAFKYSGGVLTDLGNLNGNANGFNSYGRGISSDGSIIVGFVVDINRVARAFKHTVAGGMVDLGTLGGFFSGARAISNDGTVIIGQAEDANGDRFAFKHTDAGGMVSLGTFVGGGFSEAVGISADGGIIVGDAVNVNGNETAYKYTDAGGMVSLGTLGGNQSSAQDISADGSVIVGYSTNANNHERAFKHIDGVMTDLGTLGGNTSRATAISDDGTVIIGNSKTANNKDHAFMILNQVGADIVSIDNTLSVLSVNAKHLGSVFNLNETLLLRSLKQDATLFGANNINIEVGTRYSDSRYSDRNMDSSQVAATLKIAYRFNDNFRVGIFLDQGLNNSMPDGFAMQDSMPLTSVFAHYQQNSDASGAFIHLAAAHGQSDLTITRDVLSGTEAGQGQSKLVSQGALVEAGYGFKLSKNLMINPYIGSRYTKITREGYTENAGADFPLTYDEAKKEFISALAGLRMSAKLSDKLSTELRLGLEKEISGSFDGYAGEIHTLGAFNLTPETVRTTRVFGGIGFGYKISPLQEIGISAFYSKQSTNSGDGLISYFSYSLGF